MMVVNNNNSSSGEFINTKNNKTSFCTFTIYVLVMLMFFVIDFNHRSLFSV